MVKLIDEFRGSWQGISPPSQRFSAGVAVSSLALATAARWILAMIRPDIFFTPYIPAVILATAIGGLRVGTATAPAGGALAPPRRTAVVDAAAIDASISSVPAAAARCRSAPPPAW